MEVDQVNPSEVNYSAARPIRRFVLAIVLAAMAIGAIWWIGLFTSRISMTFTEGEHDLTTGRGTIRAQIENEALLAVEVRSVSLTSDGASVTSVRLDDTPIDTGRTLPGRTSGHLVVEYTTRDCLGSGRTPSLTVAVVLKAPLGAYEEERVSTMTTAGC